MTAPIELQSGPMMDKKFGKTSPMTTIVSWLTDLRSQAMRSFLPSRRGKSKMEAETNGGKKKRQAEIKTKAIHRNQKIQPHLACATSDTVQRLTLIRVPSQVSENVVRVLNEAILYHQGDNIVSARRSLTNLSRLLLMNKAQCFDFPSKYGLEVLHRGRQLFLEKGVSCSIKHGTLLLDSSTSGAQFYSGLLNVMGAFALLISEFEIARGTYGRLIDLHHQSNTTSRSHDLAAAYNNKGCVHLIMGDLLDAHKAFETSLRSLGNSNGSLNGTKVFAVKSNMSRLNLVFRKYRQAFEQQEKLVESCKATEMKNIPYPFEAVFTVMNNQAVLHTILGNFNQAEQALWWLISYCKEMNREDSVYLVTFIRLHLSEVLLLHGKFKEADEVFSIENLNSLDDIVDRFGNLYMNVRIEALEKLLELFIRRGKVKAALGLLQTTVKILKTVFGPDHFNIASLLYKQGTILSLAGDFSSATEKFKSSVEILGKIFGFKNFLLLKCYMSLGDMTSRMNQEEQSYLYFQRATENIEAIYQVSFVNELSVKYTEITQGFKTFQRQSVFDDRIEGLVAEYGQGMAFLLNHFSNGQLRKFRADRKPVTVKKMGDQYSESMSMVSFKYSSDFIKTGLKLFRLGMIKEAAFFFQYAELHCGVRVFKGYLGVARLHSIFLKEKFRCQGTLKHDHRFRNFLEDLSSVIEASGAQSIVERIDGVATTIEFDYQRNLRPVLILLLLFSIELKMFETTFVAYDLYSKLFQNEGSFPYFLLDGIQVYASKSIITCNGETAVQDILISSQIGPKESDAENASIDTPLFQSLAYKENTTENAFLVACRTPFLLDIEDLDTVKGKISRAVQECFQMKCMEAEAKGVAAKVMVDLTPTTKCGLQDMLSMGSRIELLPLCLSEHPNNGVTDKETIFEIDTSMCQKITGVTFEDEQTSCFMFQKFALQLLQQSDPGRISSISLPTHSFSLTVLHPKKARFIMSRSGKLVTQEIQFVTTRTTKTDLADSNSALQAGVSDTLSWTEIRQTVEKYGVPCRERTSSEASLDQSVTLCETSDTSNHEWKWTKRSSQVYKGETVDTSELEYRQQQTREKVLDCLRTVSQISQLLYSVESPLTDDDICLADSSQCHNAHGSLDDQEYLSKRHDVSFVDLGDDDTRCLTASSQNREDQENTSLQHLTESSERSENNEGLTLNAHDCTTVEVSTRNNEEESMLRADLCEMLEGKRLFEEDRKSRRSLMADLQESLKKKQINSEKDDSIQSNRTEATNVSKLQSSQNGSSCGNLEVLHQNLEAQTPSGNPISRSVRNENSQRISSHDGKTAKEEDKPIKIHQLPQCPALYNVKDPNDLEMHPKCRLSEEVRGRLPKTTLEKEYCFTASNENDNSCLLERETYITNVETARNDIHAGQQKAIKTNRETSPNQEVQGTIGVDHEGQRHTKPSGNKFKSRKQLPEEESERNEVEIRGNKGNTPEKQETPCSDYDDKATGKTFGPLTGDVLPDASMNKDTSGSQKNLVDLLKETDAVDGLNLKEENEMHSVKKREPTYPYGQIHSKSKATISIHNESTTRYLCQGGNVVADGESHEDLNKNAVAVDGSVLVQNYHKDIHASVVIPNHEVQDGIGVDQRQTKPGVNELEIREQHLVEDRERSGVEIMGNKSNTPEKRPDNDEMTSARIFKPLLEDVLLDGSMNKSTSGSQKNVVDLLRETDAVDGSNLKVENGMHSVKKREPTYPYGQIHAKSRATISNHNESATMSLCQGGDVVADGESHEDLNKYAVVVDGSVLEKNCYKDIHAMVGMPNDEVQDAIAVDQRQTKPGVNKLEIRKEHLMEDRERSGVEILANKSNTPEKDGTSCPDYDEMTAERIFEPLYEDVLPDGTKNKDTGRSQNNVVDLLRKTDAVDGPNLKEENETRSLKQSVGAVKLMDPHGQVHFRSQATFSNRHETTSGSMCHGGDVVADGGNREDLINNVDTVDGPVLTQNLYKDFHSDEKFKTSVKHESVTLGSENESHTDRHPLCESRYPLEPKSNFFQSYSGDGGARPKQRLTVNAKTPLPWPSIKNPMSANSDLERLIPGLDPVFLARHVKESSLLLPFQNGGNYNHASSDCLWQEDYEQEYFSFNAQDQVFNSKDQKSYDKEEFILRDKANRYDKVIPINNALAPLSPPNGKEKESWHFPSESCKDTLLRSQCFAERTNESNPTSLPKSFEANREKLFSKCGSACAYNDMASMANDYSISVGNDECGQSLSTSENEHSWTENSLTANFRYLQNIMAKTIRLVALNATGARENDPANQTVEKTGIQEETGDMGGAEAVITQRIHETNTQVESTPSNETTVEAEQQPMAIPVQESPRPVCSHYQRRCLVRFPCCGKFFPCHRCHNESDCSEDQARAVNATHIRCTICYHEQEIDENGQRCGGCNAIMSEYFCPTCRHYTSVDKNPFHCEKCGICRIHRDRSFHCDVCNVCLDKRLEGKHKCRPDSGHDECCICLEDAFSGCQILPCSHKVHKDCAIAMIQNGVRTCPICRHPLFGQLQNSTQ